MGYAEGHPGFLVSSSDAVDPPIFKCPPVIMIPGIDFLTTTNVVPSKLRRK